MLSACRLSDGNTLVGGRKRYLNDWNEVSRKGNRIKSGSLVCLRHHIKLRLTKATGMCLYSLIVTS